MSWEWIIALIVIGAALMAADIYLPGLVLASIGVVLQIVALVLFAIEGTGSQLAALVASVVVLDGLIVWASIRFFPQTRVGKKMILGHTQENYKLGSPESLQSLVGQDCVTDGPLRPTGTALLDGKRVDVVTEGDFLGSGERVRIEGVREGRLLVRKLS